MKSSYLFDNETGAICQQMSKLKRKNMAYDFRSLAYCKEYKQAPNGQTMKKKRK